MSLVRITQQKKLLTRDAILGTQELTPIWVDGRKYEFSGVNGGKEGCFVIPQSGTLILDDEIPGNKQDLKVFDLMRQRGDLVTLQITIEDVDKEKREARELNDAYVKVYQTLRKMWETDTEGLRRLARRMGYGEVSGSTYEDLFDYLVEIAKVKPNRIKEAIEDHDKATKYLFDEAVDKKVIVFNDIQGIYKFGNSLLGRTQELSITILATNPEIREAVSLEVNGGKVVTKDEEKKQEIDKLTNKVEDSTMLLTKIKDWKKRGVIIENDNKTMFFGPVELGNSAKEVMDFLTNPLNKGVFDSLLSA